MSTWRRGGWSCVRWACPPSGRPCVVSSGGRRSMRPSRRAPGSHASTAWRRASWRSGTASCGRPRRSRRRRQPSCCARSSRHVVGRIQFSKTMRWDGGRFSRPVRWLVCKLDEQPVDVELFGVRSGGESRGHRFLGGEARIGSASTYLEDVRGVRVVADAAERRELITEGLDQGGEWIDPMGKLDEVTYLVEWPVVLEGSFDERYLLLPPRVPITAMQSHQRYFPVAGEGGGLAPRFLFVANGAAKPEIVIAGNEEVLVGRLEDASFAYERDLDRGIEAMLAELGRVSFLEGGGSLADKTARVGELAEPLCDRNEAGAGRADCRAAGGRAVQGRPRVAPGLGVLRPPGLRRIGLRAAGGRAGPGVRRGRGALHAGRRRRRAAGRRGGRAALGRRQGGHSRRRVRPWAPADGQPGSVRVAARRSRHGGDRARARLRARPPGSAGDVGGRLSSARGWSSSASRWRRCRTPSSSSSTGSSRCC